MTKEIDYENLRPEDIESEDIELKVAKGAFSGLISCQRCKIKMEKAQMDMDPARWRNYNTSRSL